MVQIPQHITQAIFFAVFLLSSLLATSAMAEDAKVKEMKFEIRNAWKAEVNIASSDGTKWDTILPDAVKFWAYMKVDTKHPGYVERIGIFLGTCTNTQCATHPLIYYDEIMKRDYTYQTNITFSARKFPVSSPGNIALINYGDQMLSRCNQGLQPDGATRAHTFSMTIPASFSVNTRKALAKSGFSPLEVQEGEPKFGGGDHTRHSNLEVKVNCNPVPEMATYRGPTRTKPGPKRKKIKVKELKLFLTTYTQPKASGSGPTSSPCKPLKVTTRIKTNTTGPVNVKLWRKIGNGPTKAFTKRLSSKSLGNGKFGVHWHKWEKFTKTTYVQYKAEVMGGTFAPSTPWKDITMHCGGGFTSGAKPQ